MLEAEGAVEGPGSPKKEVTVLAPCVQLEVRLLGSREEHRAPAFADMANPPPTPGKGDELMGAQSHAGGNCQGEHLPSSPPHGPHALITSITLPLICACSDQLIAVTFYFEIIFNLQRIAKIQSS